MGRNPKMRVSYIDDAQYFMRLAHSLELDTARPQEWRKDMIAKLENIAADFLKAPKVA